MWAFEAPGGLKGRGRGLNHAQLNLLLCYLDKNKSLMVSFSFLFYKEETHFTPLNLTLGDIFTGNTKF